MFLSHDFLGTYMNSGNAPPQAISHSNNGVGAAPNRPCPVYSFEVRPSYGTDEERLGRTIRGWMGLVGMGIITYISSNVSCPSSCSCSFLTLTLDMWCEHWGDDIHHSSSPCLDRSDGRFPRSKTRCCHLFVRDRLNLWGVYIHRLCFAGWATMEGYLETKGNQRSPMAAL